MVTEASSAVVTIGALRRITFTHDFLRPQQSREYPTPVPRNLAWLVQLLGGAARWKERGAEVSVVNAPPLADKAFGTVVGNREALREYRSDPDGAWARRYDAASLDTFALLLSKLLGSDLVIGFELSPSIKRFLHANRVAYFNVYIHPLRFLTDLCFAVTTNSSQIAKALLHHKVGEGAISQEVRRYAARFAKHHSSAYSIPSSTPILIGQTERDSALIKDARFVAWQDYEEALATSLDPYERVLFVQHPYRPRLDGIPEYLRSVHKKTVISTNASGYGILFTNTSAPLAITLSSSLGVEAQAMRIPTQFLLADPRDRFQVAGLDLPIAGDAFGHGILSDGFWDEVCSADGRRPYGATQSGMEFSLGPGYIRDTLESWSFDTLRQDASQVRCQSMLLPSSLLTTSQRETLLSGLRTQRSVDRLTDGEVLAGADLGVDLTELDGPVKVGEQRIISVAGPAIDNYLAKGFYPSESWGVWSRGATAEIWIPVDAAAVALGSMLTVKLGLQIFEGIVPKAPVIRIRSKKQLLGYVFFRRSTSNHQVIEFSLGASSVLCVVELDVSDTGSPADSAPSPDHRRLGFALTLLNWSCRAATSVQALKRPRAPSLWGVDPALPAHAGIDPP